MCYYVNEKSEEKEQIVAYYTKGNTIYFLVSGSKYEKAFPDYADYIELFYELYALIPSTALMVRRFHDFNMNPWWSLLIVPMFFLPFFKGDKEDNRYGVG